MAKACDKSVATPAASYTHAQDENEQNVEGNVDQRGLNQEIERLLGVAQGTNEPREQVVSHGKGNGEKLQKKKCPSIAENVRRRVDQSEDLRAEHASEQSDDKPAKTTAMRTALAT